MGSSSSNLSPWINLYIVVIGHARAGPMDFSWVQDIVRWPCFECEHPCRKQATRKPPPMRTLTSPGYEVELAVSPLVGLKGVAGYHTSVLVGGEEYCFSPTGINCSPMLLSHCGSKDMQRFHIGISTHAGNVMSDFLEKHFMPGTYDLLTKNCNAFSDCALFFLCEQRLWPGFRLIERLGAFADDYVGLLQFMSNGGYSPNPMATGFDVDHIVNEIESIRAMSPAEIRVRSVSTTLGRSSSFLSRDLQMYSDTHFSEYTDQMIYQEGCSSPHSAPHPGPSPNRYQYGPL